MCLFQFLCLFLPAISMSLVIHNSTERRNSSHVFISSRNPASLGRKIRQSRGTGGDHYLLCLRPPSSRPPHVFLCFDKSSFHLPPLPRELKTGDGFSAPNDEKYYWKWWMLVLRERIRVCHPLHIFVTRRHLVYHFIANYFSSLPKIDDSTRNRPIKSTR